MAGEGFAGGGGDLPSRCAELENQLALERAKNEVLMEQVLKAEDGVADRDMEDFQDVIPNEDRGYWRGQLLENRDSAVGALSRLRNRVQPAAALAVASAPAARVPLHNRETARPAVAESSNPSVEKAAKLRNRAQTLAREHNLSFTAAFKRAEQELGG